MQLLIGIAGTTTLVEAATHFVPPAHSSDPDVPPIEAKMSTAVAMSELQTLSFKSFFLQLGETPQRGDMLQDTIHKA